MATFRVTDPNTGRVIKLTGDSPPTEKELNDIFASVGQQFIPEQSVSPQSIEAGGVAQTVAALSPLAQILKATGVVESPEQAIEAGLISAGRGLTTIGRGLGLAEPEPEIVTQEFQQLQQERPVATTIGEIAGQAAPFIVPGLSVAAIPATAARVGATAALGAGEGGLITRGEARSGEEQAIAAGFGGSIAGVAELVLPRLARIGGQIIRRVLGKAPEGSVIDAAGKPSQDFVKALDESGQSFEDLSAAVTEDLQREAVDPEQAARKALLESQGLEPTRAQITRSAADFQQQQEAAKTSGRVREALEQQEAVLTSRFNNAVLDTGGQAVTPTSTVTDAVVGKATVLDQQISDLYKAARESAPGEKNVRFTSLTKKLRELAPSNRRAGGNIEAIVGDLQSKGVLDNNMKVVGTIDVETAEDVRKLTNELFDPQNPFGNIKLRELKDALDDDVFKAAGGDVFRQARRAKRDFEQELTRAKVSKFDSRKANLVRDLLENKIDPNQLSETVVFGKKWRPEDLKQLKDYIGTDEIGSQAFNDLRADVLDSIKNKSFIGPEDAAGNKALSRDKLQKSLSSIGDGKMKLLFTSEERKFLKDMLAISKLREPVRATQQGRGPTAQAIKGLENRIVRLPFIGQIIEAIDIDRTGRAVLRAKPERLTSGITPSPTRQALAQSLGALGAGAVLQDNQQ